MPKIHLSVMPTIANIISRLAYLVFIISVGTYFGVTSETDNVFLLLAPIAVLMSITISVCDVVILPLMHDAEKFKDRNNLITKMFSYSVLLLPCAAVILFITSWVFQAESFAIFYLLLPIAMLNAISSITSNLLIAENKIFYSFLGPLYGSIVATLTIFSGLIGRNEIGICAILLIYELGRVFGLVLHAKIKFSISRLSDESKRLLQRAYSNSKVQLIGAILMSLNPMVDIYFASLLNEGDATSVEYVGRYWTMVYAIFVAYLAVFYSRFSRQIVNKVTYKIDVNHNALKIGLIATIVSLAAIILSKQIIDFFYYFGGPNDYQKNTISILLQLYLLGTGAYVAGMLYVRAFSALGQVYVMTKVAAIYLFSNIILNYILIQWIDVYGIALATSLANVLTLIVFYQYYQKNNIKVEVKPN